VARRTERGHDLTARAARTGVSSAVADEVAAALALLTRLPIGGPGDRAGAAAFGLVGAGLGLAAGLAVAALGGIAALPAAILALATLAVGSGALHLDGLADTADALVAPTPEAAERARRDPRAGAAGIVALVAVLGFDAATLTATIEQAGPVAAAAIVVVAGAGSRAAAAVASRVAGPRARPGFGSWFAERTSLVDAGIAVATVLAVGIAAADLADRDALLRVTAAALAIGGIVAVELVHLRRGLDGDVLGAIVELTFAGTLLAGLLLV
jgi:adenosylcobinamide-GDP ribazoletransferase